MSADTWLDPDCAQGKHAACGGDALDPDTDELVPCGCPHHDAGFDLERPTA